MNAILVSREALSALRAVVHSNERSDPETRRTALRSHLRAFEKSFYPVAYATTFSREIRQMWSEFCVLKAIALKEIEGLEEV